MATSLPGVPTPRLPPRWRPRCGPRPSGPLWPRRRLRPGGPTGPLGNALRLRPLPRALSPAGARRNNGSSQTPPSDLASCVVTREVPGALLGSAHPTGRPPPPILGRAAERAHAGHPTGDSGD